MEECNRKIMAFPTMILIQSLDDPNKYESINIIDCEPVDWMRRMDFAAASCGKLDPKT